MTRHDVMTKINWSRIGVILGTLGAFWLLLTAAANYMSREYVTRQDYKLDQVADSAWKAEQKSMTLDVLCAPNVDPANRRCRQ